MLKMMPIGIGFAIGILSFLVLMFVMAMLGHIVNFLWPIQYSSSDLAHNAYGVLRWAVPAVGGLISLAIVAGYLSSIEVFRS